MGKLFRSYTFTWWQIAILKLTLLAIGMIAGAYVAGFVMGWVWVFGVVAAVGAIYILWESFRSSPPSD